MKRTLVFLFALLLFLPARPTADTATQSGQLPFEVLRAYAVHGFGQFAPLIQASDGIFYGTTQSGGALNRGTVFRMTASGTVKVLHSFSGNHEADPAAGANPTGGLVEGADGNLYGTTSIGGRTANGTVFRITPAGVLTTLYEFRGVGENDGSDPHGTLILASDGNFYGTTSSGGRGALYSG